jgi:hypothetical protein
MIRMASSNKDITFAAVDSGFCNAVEKALVILQDSLINDPSASGRQGAQDRFTIALKTALDARSIARTVVDSVVTN